MTAVPSCSVLGDRGVSRSPGAMPAAVTFDLDDTLYDQASWLDGAWRQVARAASSTVGADPDDTYRRLSAAAAAGSGRGGIIDSVFPRLHREQLDMLVTAFHRYRAATLQPYAGAVATLRRLRSRGVPIGLITDGAPGGQHNKIDALGIRSLFDVITVSDELGRAFRKPHERPFVKTAHALGVSASAIIHVGDRWEKDVVGARAAGYLGVIRLHTGEYRGVPCRNAADVFCVPDIAAAGRLLDGGAPQPST
ncbi:MULTISPECIES: HAD family hydrolase [Microbacterium]|uniref:HAD family hydrolase n=1 Tax=Microbacterium TaxID=33882 RepID=UPI0011EADFA6|nr:MULTISPECIES: HAD family hydrolase [Microbacterium]